LRIIGTREQQTIDEAWQTQTGLPLLLLMEHAALAVVKHCFQICEQEQLTSKPVLVLCGPGQNGGDAYACARLLLSAGWPVVCREILPDTLRPVEAQANRTALQKLGCVIDEPAESDFLNLHNGLIIDGLFGSGLDPDRPVPELFVRLSRLTARAQKLGNHVIAIDVPSGVDGNSGRAADWALKADSTVSFVYPKIGLCTGPGRLLAGEWFIDPIGIRKSWADELLSPFQSSQLLEPGLLAGWCPTRPPNAHKGMLGRVLIIAGSRGMPGAAVLAAEAAGRSGPGLVHLMVPDDILPSAVAALPEALTQGIGGTGLSRDDFDSAIEKADAVAVGPGLAAPDYLKELLDRLILNARHLVIDADALNFMALNPDHYQTLLEKRCACEHLETPVLTPHPGEAKRLSPHLDLRDRRLTASVLAAEWHSVVVLKGYGTVIADPSHRTLISMTGHDGLARGGSGDLLTGLIAGVLAQRVPAFEAAGAAVWVHGQAAELASAQLGRRAMLPRDIINQLGDAWGKAGWEVEDVSSSRTNNEAGTW
jgi:NAD(P)H-hydrate epimerase